MRNPGNQGFLSTRQSSKIRALTQRGGADGEVLALLRQGLATATRTRDVEEIRGEFVAMDSALNRLAPGDLCLILVDQVEEALAHIKARIAERA